MSFVCRAWAYRRMAMLLISIAAIVSAISAPAVAEESDSLFGPPDAPFVAPGGMFAASVPPGWTVAEAKDDNVRFEMLTNYGSAVLVVNRLSVPRGASPTQLLLKIIELNLSKLPNFQIVERRRQEIAGFPGAALVGAYDHQGNIQYPRAVEVIIIVVGNDGYLMHFECFKPAAAALAADLSAFYSTFVPRSAGIAGSPMAPQRQLQSPPVEHIPF